MKADASPIAGLHAIADRFDHVLLDQWGTLHEGLAVFPAALDCVARLREAGKRILILSNSGKRASSNQRGLAALVLNLACGNDGFHLAADIDQDLFPIDEHNRALNKLPAAQLGVLRLFVLLEQRTHTHVLGGRRRTTRVRDYLCVRSAGWCWCCGTAGR